MLRLIFLFICSCILLSAKSQTSNEDSLHLSKHLEPFRKHLDSITKGVNTGHLLTLYSKNFPKGDASGNKQLMQYEDSANKKVNSTKKLPPYKYSFNQIIPNDTNHILFGETEYDLPNRRELLELKSKYIEAKSLKDQINACINYISELNRFYPSTDNWKFSKSATLNRYINFTDYLIEKLPKDTTKAYILGNFGYALSKIDRIYWQQYILPLYLKAQQILISPYNNYLKKNNIGDDSAYFRKYVNEGSIGNALINIDIFISDLLAPDEKVDLKNELYPFLKKRLFYLQRSFKTLEIQKGRNSMSVEYTNLENRYLKALTSFKVSNNSKYYSSILYDRIIALKDYISKLFFPRNDSLSKKREYNLYYSLGYIFLSQKEYDYALKAYYKAAEIRLNFTSAPITLDDAPIYIDIMEAIQNDIKNRSKEGGQIMADVVNLYNNILDSELPLDKNDSTIISVLKLLGKSSLLTYNGQPDRAQSMLLEKKRELFRDTADIKFSTETLGVIYRGLLATKWKPDKKNYISDDEREADSIIYLVSVDSLNIEPSYNGDEYLAEKLSNLQTIENNSTWYTKTEELSEEINQKTSEITSLNNVRETLNRTISSLNEAGEKLKGEIRALNRDLLIKKKEAIALNDSISLKNIVLSSISTQNLELSKNSIDLEKKNSSLIDKNLSLANENNTFLKRNGNLRKVRNVLIVSAFALLFAVALLSRTLRKKRIENRDLDIEILNKKREAEESNLDKKLAEQKLLDDTALGHDFMELIDHVPYSIEQIEKDFPEINTKSKSFTLAKEYSLKIRDYFKANFSLKEELVNSVEKEIMLAQEYCTLLQMIYKFDGTVDFNHFGVSPELLSIQIPKHNIVNFVSNAYKHGRSNNEKTTIDLNAVKTPKGYIIRINDDGGGFENLDLEKKKATRGIKLVLRQISNYNAIKDNRYSIEFGLEDIANIYERGKRIGASIVYKIIKK